ncbi:hypothetical protein Lesp02_81330 [Lentzea sp. NBRC 105346]|nr:hypothetical protein [Lentzea sp. NBRC 105346]GLZ35946.1 hypothetical protein Lesp02_81330 [Lentzea sp. NBRC 105346]
MTTTTLHAPVAIPNVLRPLLTALRFAGHFVLALVGVIFLGSGTEY